MTGLNPEKEKIIEIATIVTDSDLNILAEGPNMVLRQDSSLFELMDDWNKNHHSNYVSYKHLTLPTIYSV